MVCCDDCGADMIEKTNSRGYAVLACKRGCTSYRTLDLETGLLLPVKKSARAVEERQANTEAMST